MNAPAGTGTFAPRPGAAPYSRMVAAQARMETRLLLRNGEQLLLAVMIPLIVLVGGLLASRRFDLGIEGRPVDLLVPGVIMRLMFPATLVLAVYLLMRGHNLPGGGFVGGLTLAVAVILQYMAGGTRWAEDHLRIRPIRWIGAGLGLAALTGAGAFLFAHPFLTSSSPVIGGLKVPSAFAFDVGVFALVVGATGLILIALAHQSMRGR